jgi:hypothetical protein
VCSKCGEPWSRRKKQRYCRPCHRDYQRDWAARKRAGLPTKRRKPVVDPGFTARQKNSEYQRRHREAHPDRKYARELVRVLMGVHLVQPPPKCEAPNCRAKKTQAHHADHSDPLRVHWLCRRHHVAIHRGKLTLPRARPMLFEYFSRVFQRLEYLTL